MFQGVDLTIKAFIISHLYAISIYIMISFGHYYSE